MRIIVLDFHVMKEACCKILSLKIGPFQGVRKNKTDFHISLGFHDKGVRLAGCLQKKWH